jgi:putative membrane protein
MQDPELPEKKPVLVSSEQIRDHLANERTYQAWMRTGIALIGFGVIIVRLRIGRLSIYVLPSNGFRLGLVFAIIGMLTFLLSVQHYFLVRDAIQNDTYHPADKLIVLFSSVITILGFGVIYYVFAIPFEFSAQLLIE